MISLFITCLLGFFCCSSINVNAIDHTKEIESHEVQQKGLANYEDLFYISSFTDYTTIDFLYAVFDYEKTDGVSHFYDADGVHQTIYFYEEIYRVNLTQIDFSNIAETPLYYELKYIEYWGDDSNNAYTDRNVKFFFQYESTEWYFIITYRTFNLYNATDPDSQHLEGDLSNSLIRFNASSTLAAYFDLGCFAYRYGMSARQLKLMFDFSRVSESYDYGYSQGKNDGYYEGYGIGYNEGLIDGASYDDTALTIFTGVIEIGLLPVNFFLQILNFEIFGVNVSGFVSALLTIAVIIIVIRLVTGKKDD